MIDLDAIRKRNNERTAYEREDCSIHAARYGGHGSYDDACSNGVEADIDALLTEVHRLTTDSLLRFDQWRVDYETLRGPVSEREAEIARFAWTGGATLHYQLLAEVARLRGQLALDDNFRDPEFGGCVPSK